MPPAVLDILNRAPVPPPDAPFHPVTPEPASDQ
jgi:hypothetical protein